MNAHLPVFENLNEKNKFSIKAILDCDNVIEDESNSKQTKISTN